MNRELRNMMRVPFAIILGIICACILGPLLLPHSLEGGILMIVLGVIGLVRGTYRVVMYYLWRQSPGGKAQQQESDLLNQLIRTTNAQGVINLQLLARVVGLSVDAASENLRALVANGDIEGNLTGKVFVPTQNVQETLETAVTELKRKAM